MTTRTQRLLTLSAVLGLAYWFFGNLYETVVISPNWIEDSPAQLTRLNQFFTNTSPTLYFVPLTPLAVALVWLLWWRNRDDTLRADYRRAGVASLLLTALNAAIVGLIIPRLFGPEALAHPEHLLPAAWSWNGLNLVRMALTATTAWFLFQAFRKLDRRHLSDHSDDLRLARRR
ncbi:hypothetical protein AB0M02_10990 [Actinoplanes sp. NPDC051861]|uniref:hypothetical protein n=1 Tax=Actinoplanes sp. NPDC051861 TaxID=3155170 RepID=UPI003441629C